jgi:hypothetical protein
MRKFCFLFFISARTALTGITDWSLRVVSGRFAPLSASPPFSTSDISFWEVTLAAWGVRWTPSASQKVLQWGLYRTKEVKEINYPQCMSPRRNWDSPTPSLASECAPIPGTKRWGAHSPVQVGVGSPNSDDWRKSLAFCLLCGTNSTFFSPPGYSNNSSII